MIIKKKIKNKIKNLKVLSSYTQTLFLALYIITYYNYIFLCMGIGTNYIP